MTNGFAAPIDRPHTVRSLRNGIRDTACNCWLLPLSEAPATESLLAHFVESNDRAAAARRPFQAHRNLRTAPAGTVRSPLRSQNVHAARLLSDGGLYLAGVRHRWEPRHRGRNGRARRHAGCASGARRGVAASARAGTRCRIGLADQCSRLSRRAEPKPGVAKRGVSLSPCADGSARCIDRLCALSLRATKIGPLALDEPGPSSLGRFSCHA